MSHPLWYTNHMMKMKMKLFRVLTSEGRETYVKAICLDHAKRVAAKLFGECQVKAMSGRFPKFDEKKVGKFNR